MPKNFGRVFSFKAVRTPLFQELWGYLGGFKEKVVCASIYGE